MSLLNFSRVDLCLLDVTPAIAITAGGKFAIFAGQNVELAVQKDVKVAGLHIDQQVAVGLVAKGGATAELSATGQTTVKRGMVMIN